jgi:hypothetical protein
LFIIIGTSHPQQMPSPIPNANQGIQDRSQFIPVNYGGWQIGEILFFSVPFTLENEKHGLIV